MPKELLLDSYEILQGQKKANQIPFKLTQVLFNFILGMWLFNFIVLDMRNVYYVFLQYNSTWLICEWYYREWV